MGYAKPERHGGTGLHEQRDERGLTGKVVRRVRGDRGERPSASVQEQNAWITARATAGPARISERETELAVTGRALLSEEAEVQVCGATK